MEKKVYVDLPPFTGRNVPITEIAAAMHKDAQYVRIGLQQGKNLIPTQILYRNVHLRTSIVRILPPDRQRCLHRWKRMV